MKRFSLFPLFFSCNPTEFTEETAPDWLTSATTIRGSTMDNRWFWENRVLTLEVGAHVDTDFSRITRVA